MQVDLWNPIVTVYNGSRQFVSDSRQSARAKALYAATNAVTDLTNYKDWATRNSVRDGPLVEDLMYVDMDDQLASQLARVYRLNRLEEDRLSVANDADFVNMCGTKPATQMRADCLKMISALEVSIATDIQNQQQEASSRQSSASPLAVIPMVAVSPLRDYLQQRAQGNGKAKEILLGVDMSMHCASFWLESLFLPGAPEQTPNLEFPTIKQSSAMSIISDNLQKALDGDHDGVKNLVFASGTQLAADGITLAACFAMILCWLHESGVRSDSILLDTTSVPAWSHFWCSAYWRINDIDEARGAGTTFLSVLRKWTTIAQISVTVHRKQCIRGQTILENQEFLQETARELHELNHGGYIRTKTLHSKIDKEIELKISNAVWSDFYLRVLKQREHGSGCDFGTVKAQSACGITPMKIAEAAPKRVTNGKHYTIADSIRVNMLECLAKWPEWSTGSIFSKISGWEPKCFFSGADYVATDPKSRTVMIYPGDDSWVSSKLLKCGSPLSSDHASPETRLRASISSAMVKTKKVSLKNYNDLRAGFCSGIDEGIEAGRKIAREDLLAVGSLSEVERMIGSLLIEEKQYLVGAMLRELLHDLCSEENESEFSLLTTSRTRRYFEAFYDRGPEEGFREFIIDRKVPIEYCRYWLANQSHPYNYLVHSDGRTFELEVSEGIWKMKGLMGFSAAKFSRSVPKGVRLGYLLRALPATAVQAA